MPLDSIGEGLSGSLTLEPGGQLELSSKPAPSLPELLTTVRDDLATLRRRMEACGQTLSGVGFDSRRPLRRVLSSPRYDAMERYFDQWAPFGHQMMCGTASLQVNIEAGETREEISRRWDVLYAVGPTLAATFANSRAAPGTEATVPRLAIWRQLDPSRTGVPPRRSSRSMEESYASWALDAPVMLVRRESADWLGPPGVTFREWIHSGEAAVPGRSGPTHADLDLHLSTLFPFVRPRGYLEVRYIDAQPGNGWIVPTAVLSALTSDQLATDMARDICAEVENEWETAALRGVTDPALRRAADRLLALAASILGRKGSSESIAATVDDYRERWTSRGLTAAHLDRVDARREQYAPSASPS